MSQKIALLSEKFFEALDSTLSQPLMERKFDAAMNAKDAVIYFASMDRSLQGDVGGAYIALADLFSSIAMRISEDGVVGVVAQCVDLALVDADTVNDLNAAGAPSFAKIVTLARA